MHVKRVLWSNETKTKCLTEPNTAHHLRRFTVAPCRSGTVLSGRFSSERSGKFCQDYRTRKSLPVYLRPWQSWTFQQERILIYSVRPGLYWSGAKLRIKSRMLFTSGLNTSDSPCARLVRRMGKNLKIQRFNLCVLI